MAYLNPFAGQEDSVAGDQPTRQQHHLLAGCLPIPSCLLPSPGAGDYTLHQHLLGDKRGTRHHNNNDDNEDDDSTDIDAELSRLRPHDRPLRPRDVPRLLSPPHSPPLSVAALSYLGGDIRPSSLLLSFLPAILPSLPAHSRLKVMAAARRLRAREATLDGEVDEYQSTFALKFAFEKTKDGTVEKAAEEMRKMASVVRKAEKLRWRAVTAAVKEALGPAEAKEFLKALQGVKELVKRKGERWHARVGPVCVPVDELGGIAAAP